MKFFAWFTACILCAALLFGCNSNPTNQSPADPNYFPMSVGDWWEYNYTATQVSPDTILWEQGSELLRVLSIAGDTYLVERTFSRWICFGQMQEDTTIVVSTINYLVTPDSVLSLFGDTLSSKRLDFPLWVGKTWGE